MAETGQGQLGGGSLPVSPGMMVSHYKIIEKIGSGGMGDVFLADDTKLGRRVAIKFLSSQIADDSSLRVRFAREVQAVATLNHPNIIHVYEVSEYQGRPYFVMEHVQGQSLREVIRAGVLGFDEILRIAIGIGEGLEAAHNLGIVHRDIKPANIVIDKSRRVKILDFGLAKRATDPDLTVVGSTLGTVSYMSPEQVQGKESDKRSDIFSLGIVLYEMITGRLPFKGAFDAATLTAIVTEAHDPLAKHRPDVPPSFQPIMDRLLAKDIGSRYQNLGELLPELQHLYDLLRYSSDPMLSAQRTVARPGGSRKLVYSIVIGGIVVVSVIALFMKMSANKKDAASSSTSQTPETTNQTNSRPAVPPPTAVNEDSIRQAELAQREARLHEMEDSIARAAATTHAATSRADSIAMQRLKDSLQHVQTELAQAKQTPPTARVDTVFQAKETAETPSRPDPVTLARARTKDSTDVAITLTTFWKALESRSISGMKTAFPDLPSKSEAMWQTFLDNAKDLNIDTRTRSLSLADETARATIAVTMNYRDARGSRSQDIVYDARLRKQSGHWAITSLEQNR